MSKSNYISGLRAVEQLISTRADEIRQIYAEYQTANPRVQAVIDAARHAGIEIQPANRARLTQISGEARPQGIVAEIRRSTLLDEAALRSLVEERLQEGKPLLLLVLDGVQDPHNLGACLRSADAAGVHAVILPKDRAAGITPVVHKVACGAVQSMPIFTVTNLARSLRVLREAGIWLYGASDSASQQVFDADLSGPLALVLGSEGSGLRRLTRELCDFEIAVPMAGTVSSLNVSVAAGVLLFEAVRQRRPDKNTDKQRDSQ